MNDEKRIKYQPKYKIGQGAVITIRTKDEKSGLEFENKINGVISVIRAIGTAEIDTYEYGITNDMPGCYHGGKPPIGFVLEGNIVLTK